MQKRYSRLQRGGVGDRREVVRFLHRSGAEHGEAGLAASHDVGVVAENRQRMRGDTARRHVHGERRQLSGDLVHIGYHQEQSLGGREGRGEGAGLERAMRCARGAGFGLHFDYVRDVAPEVFPALVRPLVGELAHGRTGSNRIDGDHLADAVRDRCRRLVAIDCYYVPCGTVFTDRVIHNFASSLCAYGYTLSSLANWSGILNAFRV